jgi:uncharacterized protein YggE
MIPKPFRQESPMRTSSLQAVAAAFALSLAALPAAADDAPPRTLTVTAEGRVSAAPDMATITLGARRQAVSAAEALRRVSDAMRPVMDRLAAAGIDPADIQTGAVGLNPVYDYNGSIPKLTGYEAAINVSVRVRDLGALGGLLDTVVGDGANELGGLSFGIADPGPLLDAARRDAVAEARRRAELYAEAAGVALGPLLSLAEAGSHVPPQPAYDLRIAMEAAASVPIAAGEVGLSATVTMVYAID